MEKTLLAWIRDETCFSSKHSILIRTGLSVLFEIAEVRLVNAV